jgi:hypothetical protein
MAVSRMHVGRLVLVRMEPRKEFLVGVRQYTEMYVLCVDVIGMQSDVCVHPPCIV